MPARPSTVARNEERARKAYQLDLRREEILNRRQALVRSGAKLTFVPYKPPFVPLALAHPAFGKFSDSVNAQPLSAPDSREARFQNDLNANIANMHDGEMTASTTANIFITLMAQHFGIRLYTVDDSGTFVSARAEANGHHTYITLVVISDSSPSPEPFSISCKEYEEYADSLYGSASICPILPCLHVIVTGPHVTLAGSAMVAGLHQYEILQHKVPLTGYADQVQMRAARNAFRAMVELAETLKTYYFQNEMPFNALQYPYPAHYRLRDSDNLVTFTMEDRLDDGRLTYNGHEEDDTQITVQFVRRYNAAFHDLCTKLKVAPSLRSISYLPGGWIMVVSDRVDGQYRPCPRLRDLPMDMMFLCYLRLMVILLSIHRNRFVLGDVLTRENIRYDPDSGHFVFAELTAGGERVSREGKRRDADLLAELL